MLYIDKLTMLEVIDKLSENIRAYAFKETSDGRRCYIKWIDRKDGMDEYKQLAFINADDYVNYNILTDNMLYFNSQRDWALVSEEVMITIRSRCL